MDNIIALIMENPEKEFHIRQMSKKLGKSPTTISKYVMELNRNDLVEIKKFSNHILFKARSESKKFRLKKKMYNLNKIYLSGLIEYLEEEYSNPSAIVLFGSFDKGEDISDSDIDLFVITPLKKEVNLQKYEKKLRHNIQLFLISSKEFQKMKLSNKELLNNVVNGTVVSGYLEVFR